MKTPTFVIDTSDTRMFYTYRYLQNKKYKVCSIANNTETGAAYYCYDQKKRFTNDELMNIPDRSDLFCGSLNDMQKKILEIKNITHHNLLSDEIFAMDNALLTAEGALMLIIQADFFVPFLSREMASAVISLRIALRHTDVFKV